LKFLIICIPQPLPIERIGAERIVFEAVAISFTRFDCTALAVSVIATYSWKVSSKCPPVLEVIEPKELQEPPARG